MTKTRDLVHLFGGENKVLAAEIGVDASLISRWHTSGKVPSHHNHKIIEAARRLGLDMVQVSACLERHQCPCCKRPLEPGQVLDRRLIKRWASS